jgi:cobalt/nickel transport system permease protein
MHLGNGALTPECAVITLGAAAIGLGAATVAMRREPMSRQKLALAAGLGALVFAAQAINVPVLPGTSAHLVGGVLLAWVLGPGLGAWTVAIILVVQALVLGDGGLSALGANILNMALLPAACVAVCRQLKFNECRSSYAACAVAAAVSVPLAALLIVGETALFRSGTELIGWQAFATRMIGTHIWIGLAEGGLTLAAVAAIAWLGQASSKPAIASSIAAAALATIAFPWSSALPDGYEAAAQASGLGTWLAESSAAFSSFSAILGEQGCLLVAMLGVGLLVAGIAATISPRRPVTV